MLKDQIEKLKAEIAQAEEAIAFIQSPQRYEPKPEENSLLHDLRGLIANEQSEADRVKRLEQLKTLVESKRNALASKQREFHKHSEAGTIAREKLENHAAKLQEMVTSFRQEFNRVLLEMKATADAASDSLTELEYSGVKIQFNPVRPIDVQGHLPTVEVGQSGIIVKNHWMHPGGVHPAALVHGVFPPDKFWDFLPEPQVEVEVL